MPDWFKELYPNVRVILDCTEIFAETPSSLVLQSETFSSYKSHTTFKGLFGITPGGAVSFVLALYCGPRGGHSIVKNMGGWLDSLGSGILVGKDILGFFKNIDLDNS